MYITIDSSASPLILSKSSSPKLHRYISLNISLEVGFCIQTIVYPPTSCPSPARLPGYWYFLIITFFRGTMGAPDDWIETDLNWREPLERGLSFKSRQFHNEYSTLQGFVYMVLKLSNPLTKTILLVWGYQLENQSADEIPYRKSRVLDCGRYKPPDISFAFIFTYLFIINIITLSFVQPPMIYIVYNISIHIAQVQGY